MFKIAFKIAVSILLLVNLNGCSDKSPTNSVPQNKERGEIISTTSLGTYNPAEIIQAFVNAGLPDTMAFTYSVNAMLIVYQTEDVKGNKLQASGTLMIPDNNESLSLVSFQHGTLTKRDVVASVNPLTAVEGLVGLLYASSGYLASVPDYTGFGVSNILHPYHHAKSLAITVIDFNRAVKNYCESNSISTNSKFFLTGYSEGGYVTLATHKEIEENYAVEFQITASAPMAGPYDLYETAKTVFQKTHYDWPAYIAFVLTAYNEIYEWNRLNDIFKTPYGDQMLSLFDGTKSFDEVNSQLPNTPSELLNQSFVNNFLNGSDTEIISAFKENTLLSWSPGTPIHFFHGDADDAVPYQNALTAVDSLKANGATNVELITLEGENHESAGLPAILIALKWFKSF